MEDVNSKKQNEQQDFIVETPIVIEEKIGRGGDEKVKTYERGKFLGKGGFAKCYEMKCVDTKKIYAAKVFEKKALTNARSKKKLINEIKLHKKLHHQNIVNFEHFFEDKDNVYILLELCTNQTLNEILKRRKRLTEIEVQCYLIQIIKALRYIHSHKIIHRDLKLGNLFVTNKLELKLGDFGLAAKLEYESQRRRTVCGTPNYIAPEILEKKNGHSFEVDIWSLGVVAYTLLFGKPPFETSDIKLTYKKIKMNSYSFPENIKVHPSAKKLISSILNLDPSKRPSLDDILEHEFFRLYNSVPVVLPLSTLACPPSSRYISQFTKNETKNFNFNNTFSNLSYRFHDLNNNLNNFPDLNSNINLNSVEDINNLNKNLSKEIINRLLHGSENMQLFHRKSESLTNLHKEETFLDKFNQILMNVGSSHIANGVNPNSSRNVNKDMNTMFPMDSKDIDYFNVTHVNKNQVVNNNFFINVENVNNMKMNTETKRDEEKSHLKSQINLIAGGLLIENHTKRIFLNKISKYYDCTNKFGFIYFVNNTHIGICFNDNSNILKNVRMDSNSDSSDKIPNQAQKRNILNHKNMQYLYIEKEAKNTLNLDEAGFENYFKKSKNGNISKDLVKKFEIFKHILNKYTPEILELEDSVHNTSINDNSANKNYKLFYVKKFLKVQQATMFRLSNKLIQVIFVDNSELVMSTESNDFFYKMKNNEELWDSIPNVMNSNNIELIKRIKYVKNLLIHFVKNQKSKKIPK